MTVISRSEASISFGIDMGKAPVPSRRYAADACSVEFRNGELRFIFAQRSLDESEFESALVVRLNPMAAHQFINSMREIKQPSISQLAERVGEVVRPLETISNSKQMISVLANLASVAVAGFEACIDFYHASAFAMRSMDTSARNELELEPVVRVEIRTGLFLALLAALDEVSNLLPKGLETQEVRNGTA